MASWIKLQVTLARSAKIVQFAQVLRMRRREALGVAVEWFCWVDSQCSNGCTGLLPAQVDDVLECKRLADALLAVGWAFVGTDGFLYITDYEQHNGDSAKQRALVAERVAKCKQAQKGNDTSVTKVTVPELPKRYLDKNIYSNKGGRLSGADNARDAEPARPQNEDDGYGVWLAAVCQAHPSARKSRVLQADVAEAAKAAYERCPEASERAELLAAYYAGKQMEDRHRQAFYRPTGQRRFFSDLEDVICHAERWAKEFGWKSGKKAGKHAGQGKCAQRAQNGQEGGSEGQQTPMASDEQVMGFHAALRGGEVWNG